ncbi:MAG: thioredoxin family protein [Bacteroidales bacterium]|nr:thioredoxin family protein [Bacteroidales bacterium]
MKLLINSIEELNELKIEDKLSFIYFKNDKCSVCDSLLPQLQKFADKWGEKVYVVDCFEYPEIAAQNLVMSVPALKVYFAGQEVISMIRFVDLAKLETEYQRIKGLID